MADRREWQDHHGDLLDSARGFDVIECESCGFKHIVPVPTPRELETVYRHDYYAVEKPLYLERHREDLDWWNLVYAERYETFEGLLPPDRRRILDVGSGPGFFLLHGAQRGWRATGVEPSAQAAAHSRAMGLQIEQDFLTGETARRLGPFDVVHMSDLLEHVPHPVEMVSVASGLLAPGGLICVVVPNDYSPFQRALRTACGYRPWWVAPPHHINYFDFGSLGRLLENAGFEIVNREATFPIDVFLLMGDNYVGNDALGRECHGKRKTLERNLALAGMTDLKRGLYTALASMGIGREAQVIGRKKNHDG